MEWIREGEILLPSESGGPDSLKAIRPWVLEEADGTLHMWYSGHDGTTWRILDAVQRKGEGWKRLGVAIDAGFSGESDQYGVQSPCAVKTPGGYLMSYAGFDGGVTRLHMATSSDGHVWVPLGRARKLRACLDATTARFASGIRGSRSVTPAWPTESARRRSRVLSRSEVPGSRGSASRDPSLAHRTRGPAGP